ncbi:MAG TPA: hypothetical protein VLA22_01140, partial [Gaiellaceae bacterium]|nr:hypothetical protein [Gaiellaceae bacterium]
SWGAASDNVAVALYRIERCAGSGCSSFAEIGTTSATSYADTTVVASSTYSYRVRAEDAAGNRSGYSNTASATTPAASTAPAEPLPILDSFDRRNENPLSDSGRWTNGIGGSAEVGLRVVSRSVLACTKSTICSAWRNDASYGPDSEVWATISTLPGDGNELRLYARLQGAGASTYDGYLLRASQLPGTDELYLERVDDGTALTLLTLSRELAVGDVLLLRVSGSTLEAWLRSGASWSLVGSVASSTYPGAGLIGVGMSGTTGRLDDFGGR